MDRIEMNKRVTLATHRPQGRYVGRLKSMLVYLEGSIGDDIIYVQVYNAQKRADGKHKIIADLNLSNDYCKGAYHVDLMRIDSRYQGNGIAPLLYRYVMKRLGVIIQAGTRQSAGGRKLWAQLAKTPGIEIFAAYRRGKELVQIGIDDEDEELHHDTMKLYDGGRSVYTFAMAV